MNVLIPVFSIPISVQCNVHMDPVNRSKTKIDREFDRRLSVVFLQLDHWVAPASYRLLHRHSRAPFLESAPYSGTVAIRLTTLTISNNPRQSSRSSHSSSSWLPPQRQMLQTAVRWRAPPVTLNVYSRVRMSPDLVTKQHQYHYGDGRTTKDHRRVTTPNGRCSAW